MPTRSSDVRDSAVREGGGGPGLSPQSRVSVWGQGGRTGSQQQRGGRCPHYETDLRQEVGVLPWLMAVGWKGGSLGLGFERRT